MNISLQTSLCNLLEILRFAGSHTRSVVNHRGGGGGGGGEGKKEKINR